MYVDLPQFKRCCLCIPLRYGLISWGYVKIALSLLLIIFITIALDFDFRNDAFIIAFSLVYICGSVDIAFNVILLVSAYKKNHRLLRVYYYYCIVGFVILTLLEVLNFSLNMYRASQCTHCWMSLFSLIMLIGMTSIALLELLLQFYLILLVRSEILKLKSNVQCKYVNVTTEGVCTLNTDQLEKEMKEKVKYDRLGDEV